jgi:hypothetical protein
MSHHFVIVLPVGEELVIAHNPSTQSPALFDTREQAHEGALDSVTIGAYAIAPATLREKESPEGGYHIVVDTSGLRWCSANAARVSHG